jgi:uncharacterized protein
MRRDRLFWIVVVSAVMTLLFLNGCGTSRPAKFYTLTPVQPPPAAGKQTSVPEGAVRVGVGPVEIPDYLNRPQVVTRVSQNELTLSEFHRWGGSIGTDITRVLLENLSVLLASKQVSVVPWTQGGTLRSRVAVDISRFDVTAEGEVWLKAKWTVFGQDGKTMAMVRESNIRQPASGRETATLVAAMSQALGNLSKDIADGLTSVLSVK